MSIALMTAVWPLELSPSEKLVMLALADNANDEGHCWPSIGTLTRKTSLSERTIQTCIRELAAKRLLSIQDRYGRSNVYVLTPANLAPPQISHPATTAPGGATAAGGGVQPLRGRGATVAPRIIIEPSIEPSRNTPAGARDPEAFDAEWLEANWPRTANNRNSTAAIHNAMALVSMGLMTWPKLRANVLALKAYAEARADPSKVPGLARYFRHDDPERYWDRDWPLPQTKAQREQDANIATSLKWLAKGTHA